MNHIEVPAARRFHHRRRRVDHRISDGGTPRHPWQSTQPAPFRYARDASCPGAVRPVLPCTGVCRMRATLLRSPAATSTSRRLAHAPTLSLSGNTLRSVILFAPSAPTVQIFILAMRTLDRSQLIIEICQRFAARCCRRNRDDLPARSILTQPPYIEFARHHLLRCPDIDVAQRG